MEAPGNRLLTLISKLQCLMTTHYAGNRELITGWALNFNDLTRVMIKGAVSLRLGKYSPIFAEP